LGKTSRVIYILGLLARAGHGKSTVAQHLVATHNAEVHSLAGPLKRAAQRVFGFTDEQVWGTQKEAVDPRYGFSPRWLLQRLGTEGLRAEFEEDIHVRALLRGLRRRPADGPPRLVVVDDVRFANDARLIAEGGPDFRGAVMKLVCTDAAASGAPVAHASEDAIDTVRAEDVAATVTSSRAQGLAHLYREVDEALRGEAFAALRPALVGGR
jgi:hypothetical protein